MSATRIGKVAPFPPLPGQPYPPARNHPRWKELYRLHDEWMMKYWPFSSEKKRDRIPFMNLAGFSTWCAPASDFDRMVWGARIAGIFFLADDYIDSGKMLDRIPGFKKAATGEGPLHAGDLAEVCHDKVFRAIKSTSHPRTFEQLTKCTHEWWDSNIHEPFKNLDQYLAVRRVNIAMYFANAYFRYCLDINLTDEQVNHPLMREAEGIVSDHVGLTNDFFSYLKEKLTNSDDTNIIRILMDHENLTYEEAKTAIEKKIRQKEQDFIPAGMAVLNDPVLGKDPEVQRWIANLPYCMGGNNAWSQESGRYNVGNIDGEVSFPSLSFEVEETPEDEVVDDTEESAKRDIIFGVKDVPPPDFAIDDDAIAASAHAIDLSNLEHRDIPRPQNVGILGIEVYFPKRCISEEALEVFDGVPTGKYTIGLGQKHLAFTDDREDINSFALTVVSNLLEKYNIDPRSIGRIEVATETIIDKSKTVQSTLMDLFAASGNTDIEGVDSKSACYASTAALFNAVNWIEGKSWDGRNAIVFAGDIAIYGEGPARPVGGAGAVALLIGPDAPLALEAVHGSHMANTYDFFKPRLDSEYPEVDGPLSLSTYLTALDQSYTSYKQKFASAVIKANEEAQKLNGSNAIKKNGDDSAHEDSDGELEFHAKPSVSISDFDHTVLHAPYAKLVQKGHARLLYNDFTAAPTSSAFKDIPQEVQKSGWTLSDTSKASERAFTGLAEPHFKSTVSPSLLMSSKCGNMYTGSLYGGLASLLTNVPSYELFDKRIAMFAYGSGCASSFFAIRVKGDTSDIRTKLDLASRLNVMDVRPCEEYIEALKLREESHNAVAYAPKGSTDNLWPGTYYLDSIDGQYRRTYGVVSK